MKLNKFQFKEISKYWLDLSKITFGSLVLKLFEPGAPKLDTGSLLTIFSGLIFSLILVIIGLRFSKEVKKDDRI